ncbi:AAA family ATPase [Synechococcus sp. A10-1-5-1]|uniref:AAA family ATPase n=1 Tax=Synechococcus sp. A10-1-5-1 TaxID=2936507 RepID=UPI002000D7C5|nr:AAA family ATPase [Synechococcus sp. A10-1-5-1]UPM50131.1 AAA family ATPase [Synechococcus sp. A10-1-5-1]
MSADAAVIKALELPRWSRDLLRFLPLKSQFLLTGNVRDRYPWKDAGKERARPLPLQGYLATLLRTVGVSHVLAFDPVNGFSIPLGEGVDLAAEIEALRFLDLSWSATGRAAATPPRFFELLPSILNNAGDRIGLLADFSSRYLCRVDLPTADEHYWFTTALVLSHEVRSQPVGPDQTPLFNPLLWIADKEGDLPPWLVVNNPRLRSITLPPPDRASRRLLASTLVAGLPGVAQASAAEIKTAEATLIEQCDGLLLVDLVAIAELCRRESVPLTEIGDGIRRYKLGVTENPWASLDRERIRSADAVIARRIKGQTHAVTKMLDIVKRAVIGLTDERGRLGRPRGVAFLAGPTGTGKTELAKTITELLFGDESAYIRFDMSEFSAEHSDQRLIGAPPGYVGYDTGGELTNAIREKPFSVVLFDEIEKAHPRILDKFLQILDDGVLTSGQGERVYFSESFLIFTSNLGIYRRDASGERVANTSQDDDFEIVERKVSSEIDRYFKLELGRPEILNRIGENVIIFDFVRPDVADQIFSMMLEAIIERVVRASGREVRLSDSVRLRLHEICLNDLSDGGRGIRNQLEAHLLNPLARLLFDDPGVGPLLINTITVECGLTVLHPAAAVEG